MIKKYIQFVNESGTDIPGPGDNGSLRISIDDDEMSFFNTEPELQSLISDNKIAIYDHELWFYIGDETTISTLKEYFPNADFGNDQEDFIVEDEDPEEDGFDEENESKINELVGFGGPTTEIEIRIEKIKGGYHFIKVIDGDAKNAKEVSLTMSQREEIERILNK
jgi:hypothetical protein